MKKIIIFGSSGGLGSYLSKKLNDFYLIYPIGKIKKEYKEMKTLKQYIKDKDLEDFEEDLMAESPPNTADAMKRFKAGKAGFTDKAHLKAKGLIARSDGKKRKSDKYK